jgi:hypothetical protein
MHRIRKGLAVFFAIVFSLLFVFSSIISLLAVNADRRLLNAATYKNILTSQQVYARMPRILAELLITTMTYQPCEANPLLCEGASQQFLDCVKNKLGNPLFSELNQSGATMTTVQKEKIQSCLDSYGPSLTPSDGGSTQSGGPPLFFKSLSVTDWENIITAILPPETLKAITEDTLNQLFAFMNGQQDSVTISFVPLKQQLSGPAGVDAIVAIIRSQTGCTREQLSQMQSSLDAGVLDWLVCKPTSALLGLIKPFIQSQIQDLASQIPDTRVILSPVSGASAPLGSPLGSNPFNTVKMARLVIHLSPDIPLFFLLLITLLVVRTPKSWLFWWGIPFLITGMLCIGSIFLLPAEFERLWLTVLVDRIPPYLSLGVVNLGHDLLRSMLQSLLAGMTLSGILVGSVGLVLIVSASLIKKRKVAPELSLQQ